MMDDTYAPADLIDTELIDALRVRDDRHSAVRISIHLLAVVAATSCAVLFDSLFMRLLSICFLAFFMATLFAPFHECTHGTAFASRRLNSRFAYLCGVFFGSTWHGYRTYHFEHHAFTQEPSKDPEISADPTVLSPWPHSLMGWVVTLSGARLLSAKLKLMGNAWFSRDSMGDQRPLQETRVMSLVWLVVLVLAVTGSEVARVLLSGFLLSHIVLGLWLSAEHSGCAESGSIFARTRSVRSNAFVRFFLWNMNFHSVHHGWPAVPWHGLARLHDLVAPHVDTHRGYVCLYLDLYRQNTGARRL